MLVPRKPAVKPEVVVEFFVPIILSIEKVLMLNNANFQKNWGQIKRRKRNGVWRFGIFAYFSKYFAFLQPDIEVNMFLNYFKNQENASTNNQANFWKIRSQLSGSATHLKL